MRSYLAAREQFEKLRPDALEEFESSIEPLRTRKTFQTIHLHQILSDERLAECRSLIEDIRASELNDSEFFQFGRHLLRNHKYFNQLQVELTEIVSNQVGEEVEPSYNFLSLYNNLGVCELRMDTPEAKWTLDICIGQSSPWPIHMGPVEGWPEGMGGEPISSKDSSGEIDPAKFTAHSLNEGDGLIFSGSSQWHYRDRIPQVSAQNFCNLIFFHYIPKGTNQIINPKRWSKVFNFGELDSALAPFLRRD